MSAAASAQWNSASQALLSHRMTSGGIVYAAGAVSRMPQTTKLLSGSEIALEGALQNLRMLECR
jgi:hypothetical protein